MDPVTAAFLNFDRRSTGLFDRDGNEVSNGDSIWLSLQKLAMTDPRAADIYLRVKQAAEAEERKFRVETGMAAVQYVDKYMDQFIQAERAGMAVPRVLPDPRDVVIEEDGTVRVVGPVTRAQAERVLGLLDLRDRNLKIIRELGSFRHLSLAIRRGLWMACRRRIYWINRQIPPRLRERVPSFEEACKADSDHPGQNGG
jgi:hypothetical protein